MPSLPKAVDAIRTHLDEALLVEQGIPQNVSRPLKTRLNSKGVKVIQCPRRYATGFGGVPLLQGVERSAVISFEDEYASLLDIDITNDGLIAAGKFDGYSINH